MSASHFAHSLGALFGRVRRWPSLIWRWEMKLRGVRLGGPVDLIGRPIVSVHPGSELRCEGGIHLFSSPRGNPLGIFQPCVIRTLAPGARLIIGNEVGMSGAVVCAANSITIGEGTILGSGAMVFDNDFHAPEAD